MRTITIKVLDSDAGKELGVFDWFCIPQKGEIISLGDGIHEVMSVMHCFLPASQDAIIIVSKKEIKI